MEGREGNGTKEQDERALEATQHRTSAQTKSKQIYVGVVAAGMRSARRISKQKSSKLRGTLEMRG